MKTIVASLAILLLATAARADVPADEKADDKEADSAHAGPPHGHPGASGSSDSSDSSDDNEPPAHAGYRLPGGIHLGGLFDAAYERTDRSAELSSGKNAFRSYHHLLFLSRQGGDVPIGFNAEVLGQYFYELNAVLSQPGSRVRVVAHAGKILVPFGPDPLYHKSYGGQTGADQRILPVIWSSYGAGVRFAYANGAFSANDDIYAVQGFDVASVDQSLNMQRDLAAYDGARIAVGNRLAVAFGPATLWYSFYWNQMRFGRLLMMQAVDATLWRPSLPVLNRLALGAGLVRAHVSASPDFGRPGASAEASAYYHFGDYLWLRVYLLPGLYLQGRTGLVTFNNWNGFAYDGSRADASDSSHQTLALVYEYASAQVMLSYHWNFEKVDERPDDFLRLMVTYAF